MSAVQYYVLMNLVLSYQFFFSRLFAKSRKKLYTAFLIFQLLVSLINKFYM